MKLGRISLVVIALIGLTAYLSLFTVLEVKQAIVLQFGDPKKVITEPGLNFKIPFIQNELQMYWASTKLWVMRMLQDQEFLPL